MRTQPDFDLIQAACDGDTDAVETVLRQYQPAMTRFAYRYCAAEDIEDAVQETLWTVYQKIGYLKTTQAFISWTFQIVRHHCYRLMHRHPQTETVEFEPWVCAAPPDDNPLVDEDLKHDVLKALGSVPLTYRQVLILRDLEGYSALETADRLGITVETVKSRLHRGRLIMRETLAAWGSGAQS
jgi:RNA polymerase sigma factor (sigma-70 family)